MTKRIDTDAIDAYVSLHEKLINAIKEYDINISALCKYADISRSSFYRKRKDATLTAPEMRKICEYINR